MLRHSSASNKRSDLNNKRKKLAYGVRTLETSQIPLPPLPHPLSPPSTIRLTLFDTYWMLLPPVEKLLLFSNPTTETLTHSSLSQLLKSSLSSTLHDFLPLAGKLVHIPATGDVVIDVSSPCFTFVEAESDLDLQKLATDDAHDAESFLKLVPTIDVTVLPIQAFAVQVTRFGCGGVAIGYSVHHSVVDGKGMMQFMEAWAAACKAQITCGGAELLLSHERKRALYDRSVIKHPKGDEVAKKFLNMVAPNLPKTSVPAAESLKADRLHCSRRTFLLTARSIQSLKQRATDHHANPTSRPPSTFIVVTAYTWICFLRAKFFDPSDRTGIIIPMDCRSRLNPPVPDEFFANCLRPLYTAAPISKLMGDAGLVLACAAMGGAIRDASVDPLRDCELWFGDTSKDWIDGSASWLMGMSPSDKFVNVTASPRFRVYGLDFGWGRPARFEAVSMNRDGEFALVGGKEEGAVQVSIVVDPEHMEAFAEFFSRGLSV